MRMLSVFVLTVVGLFSMDALAGTLTYGDMRGKWQPTGCTAPQSLAAMAKNPETPANDLNAQITARNKFVQEANAYMQCISQEAQKDADAVGLLVTQSAKAIIDKTQAEIDAAIVSSAQPKSAKE